METVTGSVIYYMYKYILFSSMYGLPTQMVSHNSDLSRHVSLYSCLGPPKSNIDPKASTTMAREKHLPI